MSINILRCTRSSQGDGDERDKMLLGRDPSENLHGIRIDGDLKAMVFRHDQTSWVCA